MKLHQPLSIEQALSRDRLGGYKLEPEDSDFDGLGRYFWNIVLCESLYAPLQTLEVALRNSLHTALSQKFTSEVWFDTISFLRENEVAVINAAKNRLQLQRKPLTGSNVVAALSFGFWTSLLDAHYHWLLGWDQLIGQVFPLTPKYLRNRIQVLKRFNDMRHLRNRVFHHEPIWNWPNLKDRHRELYDAIRWISPTLHAAVCLLDRFPSIYDSGSGSYKALLATLEKSN